VDFSTPTGLPEDMTPRTWWRSCRAVERGDRR
jgi:hypothetical protein